MDAEHESTLYPPISPYATGMLDVGDGHRMYYELSGNDNGLPVAFVHGGPGAGSVASQRRYFNPDLYKIILFDQRGAGRSQPYASMDHNTTDHLVADMEQLRQHLGGDQWLVCGGSWGSTLALAYGVRHPEACLGFILRGIFLGTRDEIDWFLGGMGAFFPEHYADFIGQVGGLTGDALFEAYCAQLFHPEPAIHMPAARAWARYESQCSTLLPQHLPTNAPGFDHYALTLARTEAHFFKHDVFLEKGELLDGVRNIAHLPATLIQGRYDVICPIRTAHILHQAWANSNLVVVPDAGHSGMEPGIARAITRASDQFGAKLSIL